MTYKPKRNLQTDTHKNNPEKFSSKGKNKLSEGDNKKDFEYRNIKKSTNINLENLFENEIKNYIGYISDNDIKNLKEIPIKEQNEIIDLWHKLYLIGYKCELKNIINLSKQSKKNINKIIIRGSHLKKIGTYLSGELLDYIIELRNEDLKKFIKWEDKILELGIKFYPRNLTSIPIISNDEFNISYENMKFLKSIGIKVDFYAIQEISKIAYKDIIKIGKYIKLLNNGGIEIRINGISSLISISKNAVDNAIKWHNIFTEKGIIRSEYALNQFALFNNKEAKKLINSSIIHDFKKIGIKIEVGDLSDIYKLDITTTEKLNKLNSSDGQEIEDFIKHLKEKNLCNSIVEKYRKSQGYIDYKKSGKKYFLGKNDESINHLKKFQTTVDEVLYLEPDFVGCTLFGSYTKGYADVDSSDFDVIFFFDVSNNEQNPFDFQGFANTKNNFMNSVKQKIGSKLHAFITPISYELINEAINQLQKRGKNMEYIWIIEKLFAMRIGHDKRLDLYRKYFIQEIKKIPNGRELYDKILEGFNFYNSKYPKIDFDKISM